MGNPQLGQAQSTPVARTIVPPIWRDEFSIGVADIDAQHRMLLDILNRVIRTGQGSGRQAKDALWEIFEDLNEYAAYHFLSEEKLMQQYLASEPDIAKHIASHRSYWVKVGGFKQRYRSRSDNRVLDDLLVFLSEWWVGHILGMDRAMGAALAKHGVR